MREERGREGFNDEVRIEGRTRADTGFRKGGWGIGQVTVNY